MVMEEWKEVKVCVRVCLFLSYRYFISKVIFLKTLIFPKKLFTIIEAPMVTLKIKIA